MICWKRTLWIAEEENFNLQLNLNLIMLSCTSVSLTSWVFFTVPFCAPLQTFISIYEKFRTVYFSDDENCSKLKFVVQSM